VKSVKQFRLAYILWAEQGRWCDEAPNYEGMNAEERKLAEFWARNIGRAHSGGAAIPGVIGLHSIAEE